MTVPTGTFMRRENVYLATLLPFQLLTQPHQGLALLFCRKDGLARICLGAGIIKVLVAGSYQSLTEIFVFGKGGIGFIDKCSILARMPSHWLALPIQRLAFLPIGPRAAHFRVNAYFLKNAVLLRDVAILQSLKQALYRKELLAAKYELIRFEI